MLKRQIVLSGFLLSGLCAQVGFAQTGTLAFQGVKNGDCESVRIFGEDASGDFLFMSADIPKSAPNYTVSPLVKKSFPVGQITIEKVECFSRKNKNLFATPTPGGILSDPYVNLDAPLAVVHLKPNETVYLGTLELHKLGWGAGLIAHDLSEELPMPDSARTQLLSVKFDVKASIGNAESQEAQSAATAKVYEEITNIQAPPPPNSGKANVGLYFKSEGLDCESANIIIGVEKKGEFYPEETIRFKSNVDKLSIPSFNSKILKSGRKHVLDITCRTERSNYGLVSKNQYGTLKIGYVSLGQFDLWPDTKAFLGTLVLEAQPMGGMNADMAKRLGLFAVNLKTDLEAQSPPAQFADADVLALSQFQRAVERQTKRAAFDSETAQRFQDDLKSFLILETARKAAGPIF